MPWPIPTAKTVFERYAGAVEAGVLKIRDNVDPIALSRQYFPDTVDDEAERNADLVSYKPSGARRGVAAGYDVGAGFGGVAWRQQGP